MRFGLAMAMVFVATCAAAEPAVRMAQGVVFVDADADGLQDPGEDGVLGAKVSNGRDVVVTGPDGRYRLALGADDTLFLIRTPNLRVRTRADGLPDTWRQAGESTDFGVSLAPAGDARLDVLVFGDPQPKHAKDVDYFRRDIVEPLRAKPAASLGLSLGDIVDDDLSLYPAVIAATTQLGLPWLHVPGNHDLDIDAARDEDSLRSWRAAFGPDTYAWEEVQASFVMLDDVVFRPGSPSSFVGGLRESQFEFLENYLRTVPRARRLVIAAHVPFHDAVPGKESFRRADRERLFTLLAPFPNVLLLTSHAHAQRHYFHRAADGWNGATPLHEYVVGAACGGFWSGLPDAQGIPDARMADGTPNGYSRLAIDQGDYKLRWHVARDPADTRIALWAPKVLRRGAYPAFAVTANVFMGMEDTRVEYRVDEGEWKPMTRGTRPDPALMAINVADDQTDALRSEERAVEAGASTHLWRGPLPTDLAAGEHHVEVRAFDRWDGELRAATSYRLDDFAPP